MAELPWDPAVPGVQKVGASPDRGEGGCMLIAAKRLPASESSCGLHTRSGPDQTVPLPLISPRADKLISSPRQALFLCFGAGGGGCGAVSSLLVLLSSLRGFSSGMFFEMVHSQSRPCSGYLPPASFSLQLVHFIQSPS